MIKSHPLHWPIGYKRSLLKVSSKFKQESPDKVQFLLRNEIKLLGGKSIIVSTNIPTRDDGYIYADMSRGNIADPGVAVYFKYKDKDVSLCCDTYLKVWENMYALALSIEGMRRTVRYGVSEFLDRAFTGFKELPEAVNTQAWYEVLGVDKMANAFQIKEAYRRMAQIHHPDAGGSSDLFAKINKAYQDALTSFKTNP